MSDSKKNKNNPHSDQDLSILVEMKGSVRTEDKTELIDRPKLKTAKKLASQIIRMERQFKNTHRWQSDRVHVRNTLFGALIGAFLLIGIFFSQQKWSKRFLEGLFHTFPKVSDVLPQDYEELRNSASHSLQGEGLQVSIAMSTQNLNRPVFYLASNAPRGLVFDLKLEGDFNSVMTENPILIQFPISFSSPISKTNEIFTSTGKPLPLGNYIVSISLDEDQPPGILARMGTNLPTDRKPILTKSFFLGGVKPLDFQIQLSQFQQQLKTSILNELRLAQDSATKVQTLFIPLDRLFISLVGHRKLNSGKRTQWTNQYLSALQKLGEPQGPITHYPELQAKIILLGKQIRALVETENTLLINSSYSKAESSQIEAQRQAIQRLSTDIQQALLDFKTKETSPLNR